MKRLLLSKLVTRVEARLGVPLPYLRTVVDHAPSALLPIGLSMPAGAYGRRVPAPVLHMVRIGASWAQDCGECVQIAVNMALEDSVPAPEIQSALADRLDELPPDRREGFEFGSRISRGDQAEQIREALRARYGERGLIEASMAAAGAQFFPVLKRGMGFAQACALTRFDLDPSPQAA